MQDPAVLSVIFPSGVSVDLAYAGHRVQRAVEMELRCREQVRVGGGISACHVFGYRADALDISSVSFQGKESRVE